MNKEIKEAVERYKKHAQVTLYMNDMSQSPYTYIDVSTGAVGMVNEAWDNDAHLIARHFISSNKDAK